MHVLQTNFNQNPNVGLYAFATDSYCLVGTEVPVKIAHEMGKVLRVPVHRLSIAGTSMLGVFCAGNSRMLLVPELAFDFEKKALDRSGIKYTVIDTVLTALGNNILANNHACVINPEFSKAEQQLISKALGVPVTPMSIANLPIPGSVAVIGRGAGLVHRDASEAEQKKLKQIFRLKFFTATANDGSPYLRSAIVSNTKGFVIGAHSTGIETTDADENLGFLGVKE